MFSDESGSVIGPYLEDVFLAGYKRKRGGKKNQTANTRRSKGSKRLGGLGPHLKPQIEGGPRSGQEEKNLKRQERSRVLWRRYPSAKKQRERANICAIPKRREASETQNTVNHYR